jgi:hypothetical protein
MAIFPDGVVKRVSLAKPVCSAVAYVLRPSISDAGGGLSHVNFAVDRVPDQINVAVRPMDCILRLGCHGSSCKAIGIRPARQRLTPLSYSSVTTYPI